jgi:hypothetical protein
MGGIIRQQCATNTSMGSSSSSHCTKATAHVCESEAMSSESARCVALTLCKGFGRGHRLTGSCTDVILDVVTTSPDRAATIELVHASGIAPNRPADHVRDCTDLSLADHFLTLAHEQWHGSESL